MPLKVILILVDSLLEGVISLFIQESKTGWMLMLISCGKITKNLDKVGKKNVLIMENLIIDSSRILLRNEI